MSNDMKIVKFETLINDVNKALDPKPIRAESAYSHGLKIDASVATIFGLDKSFGTGSLLAAIFERGTNTSLAMVFDYDKLNDYGKVIIRNSRLNIRISSDKDQDIWHPQYSDITRFKDNKYKIRAAKTLVKHCQNEHNRKEAYKFVFWTMMVLTVDKTDVEEHFSLICDFARMLKITDDEMEDMLMVIKILYHEEESGFEFKTRRVPIIFSRVLCLYND
ncbi:MAG: hypothetical protein RSF88_11775 [Lachnospiraceae bacterium]